MIITPNIHSFPSRDEAGAALANAVFEDLKRALEQRGAAVLAVSGGTTPDPFFKALSGRELDWQRVTVTLVDERWVGEDSDRSNARLVKEKLLVGPAQDAAFVPLFGGEASVSEGLSAARRRIDALGDSIDVAVLGMGGDAHTASFFPNGQGLIEALDPSNGDRVVQVIASAAGEPRITLTLAELIGAEALYLHFTGVDKRAVLDQALGDEAVAVMQPIRAVFNHRAPVGYYAD